jgi:hypothetical protein
MKKGIRIEIQSKKKFCMALIPCEMNIHEGEKKIIYTNGS